MRQSVQGKRIFPGGQNSFVPHFAKLFGKRTSETGISGLISASRCCSFPHPATPVIIANASPSARHFLIFLFHISVPVLSA